MTRERWWQTFRDAPEVFDAFRRAEDPDGRIVAALRRHVGLTGRRVLEIGCGTGRLAQYAYRDTAAYVGVEPVEPMLTVAHRVVPDRVQLLRGRGQELPIASRSIDAVLAGWVFANLPERVRPLALDEASRVLRPGARGGGIWLVENHWRSEFQDVRGLGGDRETSEAAPLLAAGFRVVETIDTEIRFRSTEACVRIVGHLCGEAAQARLRAAPRSRLGQRVVLLQRDG